MDWKKNASSKTSMDSQGEMIQFLKTLNGMKSGLVADLSFQMLGRQEDVRSNPA